MRRITKLLAVSLFASSLLACSNKAVSQEMISSVSNPAMDTETKANSNVLVVYFSVMETDGTDTVSGASRVNENGELLGNTEYIAKLIQEQTGGDLFQIQTEQEYQKTHEPLLEFAHKELEVNARPALSSKLNNLDQYSTVFLGYPTWNADLPMPLYTFLETYDFTGKTIIPFNTHGGSGFAGTIHTIETLQPEASVIEDGLSVSRTNVSGEDAQVKSWVDSMQSYLK